MRRETASKARRRPGPRSVRPEPTDGRPRQERPTPPAGRERFETPSGIELRPFYDRRTAAGSGDPAPPGEFPYTRGIHATMYRARLWTMRQYAGFGSAADSNRRFRELLAAGQTGLSIAFDLPTQLGLDSDHPRAKGEVGRVGVAIGALPDMETLLSGIPLDRISASMTINATAPILLALYLAAAEKRGVPGEKLAGTVQNDILKEYVARGNFIFPAAPSLRLCADVMQFCRRKMPRWNPISISGYHIREAGATAVQEVGFTLAHAVAYLEAARSRRMDLEDIAARISFFFGCHNHFFEEAAKFRAARALWASICRRRFKLRSPDAQKLRFHAQTCGVTLTAQQPDNNVVRVALQALAAVLGGTQSLHTNSRDEALGLPTQDAAMLALRTQQILAHESGVADVVDPLGGSFYVESLTAEIAQRAEELLAEVDRRGGALACVESGWEQRQVQESAYRFQREVEAKRRIVVGVNEHARAQETEVPVLTVDPESERAQVERLRAVRAGRDAQAAQRALSRLRDAARGDENLVPPILDAVRAYATVGEISDALRSVFGEFRESVTV